MYLRFFFFLSLLFFASHASSQNVQLHYDFRHSLYDESAADLAGKNFLFSTVEMFRPDKYGSTFFFIDMAYSGTNGSISTAYWEIARDLRFWDLPLSAHLEYNGGITLGGGLPNAYLLGASYDFSVGKAQLCTYMAYKYNAFSRTSHDAQWTVAWNWTTLAGKLTLCGFMDLWSENKNRDSGGGGKKAVLLAQPQFWFNATKHLAVGSEVEVNSNFYSTRTFILPTIAAKWTF